MASIWEKAISILVVNLSSGHGYLIIAVQKNNNTYYKWKDWLFGLKNDHSKQTYYVVTKRKESQVIEFHSELEATQP